VEILNDEKDADLTLWTHLEPCLESARESALGKDESRAQVAMEMVT